MATRTEPTEATKAANAALEVLTGDFADKAQSPGELVIETSRGPWAVYSGPVSMRTLSKVQDLLGGDSVPLENMVDVILLLARTQEGDLMFREIHKASLLEKVDPVYLIKAAEFLGNQATEALTGAQETAGKD